MTTPIPADVREKIQDRLMKIFDRCEVKKDIKDCTKYIVSLISEKESQLETFKDAYVERNEKCNQLSDQLEAARKENDKLRELLYHLHESGCMSEKATDATKEAWVNYSKSNLNPNSNE